ncbi:right-handed parallel beta-helix repeat-containing protein [Microlunatus flavus]|uniref:Right handed beta helix region n=1 Tax=Microlunatus flavus TaxID=1036181 RepID=A0A1H9DFJ6_9ACTN|nr:hypothetical protein [Microlunatus flavus]SEQ12244.1 hypothetical protein SAMN05421756_102526 [Microlunatus flavus]
MRRHPALLVLLGLVAGLLLGGSAVAVAAPKDTCDKLFTKSSTSKLKAYLDCREDRQDAALARIEARLAAMPTTGAESPTTSPKPSASPTSTSKPSPSSSPTTNPPKPAGFPDASSTGVPAGTTLKAYSGPSTITADGTVIDGKKITSCLVVKADDVTIKNSLISSSCFFNVLADDGGRRLLLSDVEIDGRNNAGSDSAVAGGGYTCLRCDVHGTIDGFKAGTDVTIKDSWIHDLAMTDDSHNDGIQSLGTTSLKVQHNTIVLGDGATSAVMLSTGSADAMRNVSIDGNLLGGGAFTVYGGYQAGTDAKSKVSGIAITDNRFSTRIHPKSGAFGPLTSTDSPVSVSGNTWYDGPNAGASVG